MPDSKETITQLYFSRITNYGTKIPAIFRGIFEIFRCILGFVRVCVYSVVRNSSVRTATRYGLDGPGIETQWRSRFSATVQTGSGAHPASYTMGTGAFPAVAWR
jgi:hypothetical protein